MKIIKQVWEQQKEYHKSKINCSCGCEVIKRSIKLHERTEKHKKIISSN
jgi:hypothetical protein